MQWLDIFTYLPNVICYLEFPSSPTSLPSLLLPTLFLFSILFSFYQLPFPVSSFISISLMEPTMEPTMNPSDSPLSNTDLWCDWSGISEEPVSITITMEVTLSNQAILESLLYVSVLTVV